jgi:DNA-binding response OmpR family regulator
MIILLAEDDERLARMLIHLLKKDGHTIDHANDGIEASSYLGSNSYDVAILDWMMPGKTGIEVCYDARKSGYSGAILMLTAKDTTGDKVEGLEKGDDDYLVKPFEYEELHARLKALSRRSGIDLRSDVYSVANIRIDRGLMRASIGDHDMGLSKREFSLLDLLASNPGQTIPRQTIIDRVWGMDSTPTDNNLDAFIKLLRRKFDKHGMGSSIRTVRGIGYRLEV